MVTGPACFSPCQSVGCGGPIPKGPRASPRCRTGPVGGRRGPCGQGSKSGPRTHSATAKAQGHGPGTWALPEVDASVAQGCGVSLGPGLRRLLGRFSLCCRPHPKIKPSLIDVSVSVGRVYLKCWVGQSFDCILETSVRLFSPCTGSASLRCVGQSPRRPPPGAEEGLEEGPRGC